jgi:antitoxin VapB
MLWHMSFKPEYTRLLTPEHHLRLFRNEHNQTRRILREFELKGDEALIHKEGNRLILALTRKGMRLALLAPLPPLTESFTDALPESTHGF